MSRLPRHQKSLPSELRRLKNEKRWTTAQLSRYLNLAEGTLARMLVGSNSPDPRNIKMICGAPKLAEHHRAGIIKAYLEDMVPLGCRHLVHVAADLEAQATDKPIEKLELSSRAQLTLRSIANLFEQNPAVVSLYKALTHFLRSGQIAPSCPYTNEKKAENETPGSREGIRKSTLAGSRMRILYLAVGFILLLKCYLCEIGIGIQLVE
jgi:transcriptional regulator with XRE-family HTH domain